MPRYYERRTGDWEQRYLLNPADHEYFFRFRSQWNAWRGFQIQKIWIWIESIESFLRVGTMDSKSFFGFAQRKTRNRKYIFGFEIGIWILNKGTLPGPGIRNLNFISVTVTVNFFIFRLKLFSSTVRAQNFVY